MKKDWKKIGVILIVLLSFKIAYAASGQPFGGKITEAPDNQVKTKDDSTYTCKPENKTIVIKSFKGPTKYYIGEKKSKTNKKESLGQWVLGRYNGTTTISCTNDVEPWDTITYQFNTIQVWGSW